LGKCERKKRDNPKHHNEREKERSVCLRERNTWKRKKKSGVSCAFWEKTKKKNTLDKLGRKARL